MVPTPHIAAGIEDIAPVVLMPGDPKRSKWIAEEFLDNKRLVNDIRGIQGYTGTWNGHPITVMASGVGIPSVSVYAYELFNFYNVDMIIRCGTAGAIQDDINVGDVIVADIAYTDSDFIKHFALPQDYVAKADPEMLAKVVAIGKDEVAKSGGRMVVGPVLTQEIYYSQEPDIIETWQAKGVLGFEMEAAALYANAAQAGKKAFALFTASNNILRAEEMDPKDRETSLRDMIRIALRAATE